MLWSLILFFFLLAATTNSLVDSVKSNYYKKIVIEYNGKKHINPNAFSDMNFTLETLDDKDFYFIVRKSDREVIPIKMYLSTSSSSTKIVCDGSRNGLECISTTGVSITDLPDIKDQRIPLSAGYKHRGFNFLQLGSKYLLKISSTFTPAYDTTLYPFLMEWVTTIC
uniref:Uncharacterized protein n=1 Tax=Panagrolaimus davidi TaxID=227884 RepID=A0A914PT85_9BILA